MNSSCNRCCKRPLCAAKGCTNHAEHGAHVYDRSQLTNQNWNICWIIPTCSEHNKNSTGNKENYPLPWEAAKRESYFQEALEPNKILLKNNTYRDGMEIKQNTFAVLHVITKKDVLDDALYAAMEKQAQEEYRATADATALAAITACLNITEKNKAEVKNAALNDALDAAWDELEPEDKLKERLNVDYKVFLNNFNREPLHIWKVDLKKIDTNSKLEQALKSLAINNEKYGDLGQLGKLVEKEHNVKIGKFDTCCLRCVRFNKFIFQSKKKEKRRSKKKEKRKTKNKKKR